MARFGFESAMIAVDSGVTDLVGKGLIVHRDPDDYKSKPRGPGARQCPGVDTTAQEKRGDLYLLTHHQNEPFEQDGIRDGRSIRSWMTARFVEKLEQSCRPYVILHDLPPERLAHAVQALDVLRANAWQFNAPLG